LKNTYGDGSTYDMAVVDNHMVMHGRLPYAGERVRKVFVVLGI
jgi:hypothetical protein